MSHDSRRTTFRPWRLAAPVLAAVVALGPISERQGTWVSRLVPLAVSGTRTPIAVLGMDADTGDWSRDIAARCVVPVAVTASVLLLLGVFILTHRRAVLEKQRLAAAAGGRQEALRFLQTLIDALPIPVFFKDRDGRYTGCNKAYESFYGQPRDFLIGKTVFETAPPDRARAYHEKDEALFREPGVQVYEAREKDAHGGLHDVVFQKATYSGPDGRIAGLIGGILDLTDRTAAEEERTTLLAGLLQQQKLAAIGTLARGMAHEINNPLNGITNYAELIREKAAHAEST